MSKSTIPLQPTKYAVVDAVDSLNNLQCQTFAMESKFEDYNSVWSYLVKLARFYEIPPPRIVVMDAHPKYHAYFDLDEWTIYTSLPVPKQKIRHEFLHYCIAIIKKADSLEEDLADVYGEIEEEDLDKVV